MTDGSGGAIIAWGLQDNYYRVYAQRVNGGGIKQWATGPNGLQYFRNQRASIS